MQRLPPISTRTDTLVPYTTLFRSRLETRAPQLQSLDHNEPAALEVRRLLSDHLPELVTGYQSIPEPLRRQERNGRVPDNQLKEGLEVIDREIGSMTENLEAGDLDKFATHNRILELKYQDRPNAATGKGGAVRVDSGGAVLMHKKLY